MSLVDLQSENFGASQATYRCAALSGSREAMTALSSTVLQ